MDILTWWNTINDAQASIVSSSITVLAAVGGVSLGSLVFGNKVKSLKDAIKETTTLTSKLNETLDEQQKKLDELGKRQDNTLFAVNSVRTVQETQSAVEEKEAGRTEAEITQRERFMQAWNNIANLIESNATDPRHHHKRRDKYRNIGRWDWTRVVEMLINDAELRPYDVKDDVSEAALLWESWKRNSSAVPENAVTKMEELSRSIQDVLDSQPNGDI